MPVECVFSSFSKFCNEQVSGKGAIICQAAKTTMSMLLNAEVKREGMYQCVFTGTEICGKRRDHK